VLNLSSRGCRASASISESGHFDRRVRLSIEHFGPYHPAISLLSKWKRVIWKWRSDFLLLIGHTTYILELEFAQDDLDSKDEVQLNKSTMRSTNKKREKLLTAIAENALKQIYEKKYAQNDFSRSMQSRIKRTVNVAIVAELYKGSFSLDAHHLTRK